MLCYVMLCYVMLCYVIDRGVLAVWKLKPLIGRCWQLIVLISVRNSTQWNITVTSTSNLEDFQLHS